MHTQLLACWPIVRCDMSSWSECTEKAMHIGARDYVFKNLDSFRNFTAIFIELDIVEIQVKHIPVSIVSA